MKTYFKLDESPSNPGKYIIRPVVDNFPIDLPITGSFALLAPRVMGLSFAQYLRMCRDLFCAEIVGKNSYYPVAYFRQNDESKKLVKILNERANKIFTLK